MRISAQKARTGPQAHYCIWQNSLPEQMLWVLSELFGPHQERRDPVSPGSSAFYIMNIISHARHARFICCAESIGKKHKKNCNDFKPNATLNKSHFWEVGPPRKQIPFEGYHRRENWNSKTISLRERRHLLSRWFRMPLLRLWTPEGYSGPPDVWGMWS